MNEKSPIKPEDTYVFNLDSKILDSLQLMYFDSSTAQEILPIAVKKSLPKVMAKKDTTVKDQNYYKSDLHKLNLKREIRGLPKLTEEQFEELADELNESISGSEESDSDDDSDDDRKDTLETIFEKSIKQLEELKLNQNNDDEESIVSHLATKSPYILFKSNLLENDKCFGIYKALFSIDELQRPLESLVSWKANNNLNNKSALLMIGGGHFAGAIINHKPKSTKGNFVKPGDSILEHAVDVVVSKSFHRYTTRRKQGGSQSASDNARGKANSAGSSLRRANEAALTQEVRELLQSWKSELDGCDSIYIRANGSANRKIIVGYENSVLKNNDPRIKSFPFTTKRATTTELKRAWVQLTYLIVTNKPKFDDKKFKKKIAQEQLKQSTISKEKSIRQETEMEKHSKEIVGYLKKARGPILASYLKKFKLSSNLTLEPESEYYSAPTMLHFASSHGLKNLIPILIKNLKADPTIQNKAGKTAYEISANKSVRLAFQIVRNDIGETDIDWEAARVGKPISKEEVEKLEKEAKEKEEEEKKELIKIEQAKIAAEPPKPSTAAPRLGGVSLSQTNLNTLNDDQRMRLMREQRARAAEARFKQLQK